MSLIVSLSFAHEARTENCGDHPLGITFYCYYEGGPIDLRCTQCTQLLRQGLSDRLTIHRAGKKPLSFHIVGAGKLQHGETLRGQVLRTPRSISITATATARTQLVSSPWRSSDVWDQGFCG